MNVYEDNTPAEWAYWLKIHGPALLIDERDIRITDRSGFVVTGSVSSVSSSDGVIGVRPYGMFEEEVRVHTKNIDRIEVFNSRRLWPDRAYSEMNEMFKIVSSP